MSEASTPPGEQQQQQQQQQPEPAAPPPAAPPPGEQPPVSPLGRAPQDDQQQQQQAGQPAAWLAELPEELRGDATLQRYKSVQELAQGLLENKKLARSKVMLPNADDPDSFTRFAAAVRPEDASAYDFGIPDGEDATLAEAMRPVFHEAGLEASQPKRVIEGFNKVLAEQKQALDEKGAAALDALKAEMGERDFEKGKQAAAKLFDRLGIPQDFDADMARFAGGANFLRYAFALAEMSGELGRVGESDINLALGGLKGEAAMNEARRLQREYPDKVRDPHSPEGQKYAKLVEAARNKG